MNHVGRRRVGNGRIRLLLFFFFRLSQVSADRRASFSILVSYHIRKQAAYKRAAAVIYSLSAATLKQKQRRRGVGLRGRNATAETAVLPARRRPHLSHSLSSFSRIWLSQHSTAHLVYMWEFLGISKADEEEEEVGGGRGGIISRVSNVTDLGTN
jgi:hypothetical protein